MPRKPIDFNLPAKRTKTVCFWVSEEEWLLLHSKKTTVELATWARATLLAPSNHHHSHRILNPQVVRILAGMGNNLNQLTRRVNTEINDKDKDTETKKDEAKDKKLPILDAVRLSAQLHQLEQVLHEVKQLLQQKEEP